MTPSTFDLHDVVLSVASEDQRVRAAIQGRLKHFESAWDQPSRLNFEVALVQEHDRHAPAAIARSVYESLLGDVLYSEETDELFMQAGPDVRVLLDGGTGLVRASVRGGAVNTYVWLLTHPLMFLWAVLLPTTVITGLFGTNFPQAKNNSGPAFT